MTTTEILEDLIFPAIYKDIETVLPEFNFKQKGTNNGWESTNGQKIDGTIGDSSGKVRIYANNISHLIDHRGGFISIWNYIQERDKLSRGETLKKLAQLAGVALPEKALSQEELDRIEKDRRRAQIWETANTYLKHSFYNPDHPDIESEEAKAVQAYLLSTRGTGGRGFLRSDIELNDSEDGKHIRIEVGVITEPAKVYNHVVNTLGYDEMEVRDILQLSDDGRIGKLGYHLTLPYRDANGAIHGLLVRNIQYKETEREKFPKYLFTKSLQGKKGKLLYNLKPLTGSRDLLIVESQIDAQLATVREIENVVAIGGKSLTPDQVKQILTKKVKPQSITLLLDNEPETIPQIKAAINLIISHNVTIPIYVAELPGKIKDPEEYLTQTQKDGGPAWAERFKKEVLANKTIYWKYLLHSIIEEFKRKTADRPLTDTDEQELQTAVIIQANKIALPVDRESYINLYVTLFNSGGFDITNESLQATVDKIRFDQEKEDQLADWRRTLNKGQSLLATGEPGKIIELFGDKIQDLKEKSAESSFNDLLEPTTEAGIIEHLMKMPDDIETGYLIGKEKLSLPSGAISILAAPTSHGKTTFLINLALNVANKYANKNFHLFSYEEDAASVLVSSMSTFIGDRVSSGNRRSIKSYLRGNPEFLTENIDLFIKKKKEFFETLIATQRYNVHYVNYDSDTLIEAIRFLHRKGNMGGVFIDYMQLLHKGNHGNNKYNTRQEELKQVCIDLKDLAVETGLPIIIGAQFNRKVLNALHIHATAIGEAGDIERIANLILGFWNNNFPPLGTEGEINEIQNKGLHRGGGMFVKILKQRGGVVGEEGRLEYDGNVGKITNDVPGIYEHEIREKKKAKPAK